MKITLETSSGKKIDVPVTDAEFNEEKPLVVKFLDRKGKVIVYSLRITSKIRLVLN